jgi:hypothetical protein
MPRLSGGGLPLISLYTIIQRALTVTADGVLN